MRAYWLFVVLSLICIGCNSATNPLGERGINHVVISLDAKTVDAIIESDVMEEFGFIVTQNVQTENDAWQGVYLIGSKTYVEIFPYGTTDWADKGMVSIAFGVDSVGDVNRVEKNFTERGLTPYRELKRRPVDDGFLDWFHSIRIDQQGPEIPKGRLFATWLMEYTVDYMESPITKREKAESNSDTISRERYLPDEYASKQMRDVVSAQMTVPKQDVVSNLPMLEALGYSVAHEDKRLVARNAEGTIVMNYQMDDEPTGISMIEFTLNSPVKEKNTHQIGESTLIVGPGNYARWEF